MNIFEFISYPILTPILTFTLVALFKIEDWIK